MYGSLEDLRHLRDLRDLRGNIIKTEFVVRDVRVQMYVDHDGVEIHVLGAEQLPVEAGEFHLEASLSGDRFMSVAPVTRDNEKEYMVFCALESLILGMSEYNMLSRIGYDIPDTEEFDRLYTEIREVRQEIWESGVTLPIVPLDIQWLSLEQVFALAPMFGAPETQYDENGTLWRVDYGDVGYAILDTEEGIVWEGGEYSVMYLWRKKKHG